MKKLLISLALALSVFVPSFATDWYWIGSNDTVGYFAEMDSMGFAFHPNEKTHTAPTPFSAQQAADNFTRTMLARGFNMYAINEELQTYMPEWEAKEEAYLQTAAQESSYQYISCWVKQEYPATNETKLYKNIYDVKGNRWCTVTIVSYKNSQQTGIQNIQNPSWNYVVPGSYDEDIYNLCTYYYNSTYHVS